MTEPKQGLEVAVTVPQNEGQFLLVKRADNRELNPGCYEFPGGKIEDELPEEAALRELKEETGSAGEIVGAGDPIEDELDGTELVLHPYIVELENAEIELSSEHSDYMWAEKSDIEGLEAHNNLPRVLESVEKVNGDVTVGVACRDGRFLVMRRSEHESMSGNWEFPGGVVEDETVREAAVREFEEESGLQAEVIEKCAPYIGKGSTGFWRLHPVLIEPADGAVVLSREHDKYRWVERSELENLETMGDLKALRKLELTE